MMAVKTRGLTPFGMILKIVSYFYFQNVLHNRINQPDMSFIFFTNVFSFSFLIMDLTFPCLWNIRL